MEDCGGVWRGVEGCGGCDGSIVAATTSTLTVSRISFQSHMITALWMLGVASYGGRSQGGVPFRSSSSVDLPVPRSPLRRTFMSKAGTGGGGAAANIIGRHSNPQN